MPNRHRDRGIRAEREVAARLAELTGWPVRRRLQEGRADDTGDLEGVPGWCLQVRNYTDAGRAIREGLPALVAQQENARAPFGALLVRRPGGRWFAVVDLDHFADIVNATTDR